MPKPTNQNKRWTPDEMKYIRQNWGDVSMSTLQRTLKRSVRAISRKAYDMKLRDMRGYTEHITLRQLSILLGYDKGGCHYLLNKQKLDKVHFPYFTFRTGKKRAERCVDMDKFWKWFEKNKFVLSLHRTEKGDLGVEPDWVDIKRKADKRYQEYNKQTYTDDEIKRLISMVKEYKYTWREISIRLRHTEGSINHKLIDLGIKDRPLTNEVRRWTDEDLSLILKMREQGYRSCIIAEYVNHSASSIDSKLASFKKEKATR